MVDGKPLLQSMRPALDAWNHTLPIWMLRRSLPYGCAALLHQPRSGRTLSLALMHVRHLPVQARQPPPTAGHAQPHDWAQRVCGHPVRIHLIVQRWHWRRLLAVAGACPWLLRASACVAVCKQEESPR